MSLRKFFLAKHFTAALAILSALAAIAFLGMAVRLIDQTVGDEKEAMLYTVSLRAQSLGWALEGAARLHKSSLDDLLVEMGQQPGISYIALVNEDGQIEMDSNPAMAGKHLYTPHEMRSLSPANIIQGRFSPDDKNIFETWRIFNPGRLRGHSQRQRLILFIALDVANIQREIIAYEQRLFMEAALLLLLVVSAFGLAYFAFNYQRSRHRLEDARALADQIIKSYPSPLLVTDLLGNIKFSNAEARAFFSIGNEATTLGSLPGLHWDSIMADLRRGKTLFEQELTCYIGADHGYPVRFSDAIIRDRNNIPQGWLFFLRDLTQIKNLEEQLAESRRLAALGHMASGVAHEIRNPLSSIRGYASYLRQRLADNAWAVSTASLLEDEALRLDRALSDLLQLSKKPKLRFSTTSIGELLRKVQLLLEPDARAKNIQVRLQLPAEDVALDIDRERMLQALLNIGLNAVEATPSGGKIDLGVRPDPIAANVWVITIHDNGKGISPQDLEHIFTPYFTTRADGSGLGLTMTRQIVESHGGKIDVLSTPGEGTIFHIYLRGEKPCQNVQ